jgi:hypothetical protein
VATTDMGMEILIIMVVPIRRRKINSITTAKIMPYSAVSSTSFIAVVINSAWF